jgi:molybdopterin-guanine dinucleotide biosynthesis protein
MSKHYRFDLRKDGDDTWEIFDTTNGRTVVMGGQRYCGLPQDSADTLADFMNSTGMMPDRDTLH